MPSALTSARSPIDPMQIALYPHILLGMPHLTPFGLARTWLMKELGHRHWLMLAKRLGMATADFRSPEGNEAYAAISALKVNARLSAAKANDVLSIRSELYSVSHARMESVHHLAIADVEIGTVTLQSTFVARAGKDNRSITRSLVRHFRAEGPVLESSLALEVAQLREWGSRFDREEDNAVLREFSFRPSPFEEFNGAGLFYFAEFIALVGRAFCNWEGNAAAAWLDQPLSLLFLGNIDPGEALWIGLHAGFSEVGVRCCTIKRSDGSIAARVRSG
ncbi:Pnap_2097 family protein [Rhizobium hainanense]|nr:Pnap_2097 family protein [Rhizobium hainanense]